MARARAEQAESHDEVLEVDIPLIQHECKPGQLGRYGTRRRNGAGEVYIECNDCKSTSVYRAGSGRIVGSAT
jgi:hypothetical protein